MRLTEREGQANAIINEGRILLCYRSHNLSYTEFVLLPFLTFGFGAHVLWGQILGKRFARSALVPMYDHKVFFQFSLEIVPG